MPAKLIDGRQYVLDSEWGDVQPNADTQNRYLERHFIPDFNSRFGVEPAQAESAFARVDGVDLDLLASIHHQRMVRNDNTVLFDNGSEPPEERQSRGLLLRADTARHTATLVRQYSDPSNPLLSASQGNGPQAGHVPPGQAKKADGPPANHGQQMAAEHSRSPNH